MNLHGNVLHKQCWTTCVLFGVELVSCDLGLVWDVKLACPSLFSFPSISVLLNMGQELRFGISHYLAVWKLWLVFQNRGSRGKKGLIREKVVGWGKRCCVLWQGALFVYTRGQACGRTCEASAGSWVYLGAFIVASCSSSLVLVGMQPGLIRDSAPALRVVSRDSIWASWAWRPALSFRFGQWQRPKRNTPFLLLGPLTSDQNTQGRAFPRPPSFLSSSLLPSSDLLSCLPPLFMQQSAEKKPHQLECTSVHGCACTVKYTQLGWEANMKQMVKWWGSEQSVDKPLTPLSTPPLVLWPACRPSTDTVETEH